MLTEELPQGCASRLRDRIGSDLPGTLTVSLWDFTWYTRTGPGEPFADLDLAFEQAVERGYNTIRICAMPFLLSASHLDATALRLGPLGRGYAQRTRWYDVKVPTVIDALAHLLELFRAAARHDCFVIVTSWEFQQSSAFSLERDWFDALMAVNPERRPETLAQAHSDLVDLLRAEGLLDQVAFVELHNEVQAGHLTEGLDHDQDLVVALRPRLQRRIDRFHALQPDVPVTVNYSQVPATSWRGLPTGFDVLVVPPYIYGVLDGLVSGYNLRGDGSDFPQELADAQLLRPGAPRFADRALEEADTWKLTTTIVGKPEISVYDWCDLEAFDRFLHDHYAIYRLVVAEKLALSIGAADNWAQTNRVPVVLGEGWVGYTPVNGIFEEGPVGREWCRFAVLAAARVGVWGSVVCSNAAPHHPMWSDIELQVQCNEILTNGRKRSVDHQ